MLGHKSGVAVRLQEMVAHNVVAVHCVAHNLELGAVDASKTVPYLTNFNATVHSIYKLYWYSPKKRRELKAICDMLEQDQAFYTSLHSTRWVASQHRALLGLEKHLPATMAHLEHVASNGTSADAARAKGILKDFATEKFMKYLHFMIDIMNILACLSQQF